MENQMSQGKYENFDQKDTNNNGSLEIQSGLGPNTITGQISGRKNDDIDLINQKYPYCIVWTTLPLISCLIPCIGHTGICMSDGTIHDFAGSYYISVDDFAFGKPLKYVRLDNSQIRDQKWDQSVRNADQCFVKTMHNLCCNNCHSHVAKALNEMQYQGKTNWNMISVWWLCIFKGKYVSFMSAISTYWGFLFLVLIYFMLTK